MRTSFSPFQPVPTSHRPLPSPSHLEDIDALAFAAVREQLTLAEGRRLGLACRGLLHRTGEAEVHHPALARLARATGDRRRLLAPEGAVPPPATAMLLADTEYREALAGVAKAQARAIAIRDIKAAAIAQAASLQATFAAEPRSQVEEVADFLVCVGRPAEALHVLAWGRAAKACSIADHIKAAARAALHLPDGEAAIAQCEALLREPGLHEDLQDRVQGALGTIRLLRCGDAAGARDALDAMQVKDARLDCMVKDALHQDKAATAALGAFLHAGPPPLELAELCASLARTCSRAIDKAFYVDRALALLERLLDEGTQWRVVLAAARSPHFESLHDQPRWKHCMGKFSREWLAQVRFSLVLPAAESPDAGHCPA